MNSAFIIVNILGVLFQALISERVFSGMEEERKCNKYVRLAVYAMYIVGCSVLISFVKISIVLSSVTVLLTFLIAITYNISWINRVVISISIMITFVLAEILIGLIISLFTHMSISDTQNNVIAYAQGVLGSKLIVFFILSIMRKRFTKNTAKLTKGMYASMMILPIISNFIVFAISQFSYENTNQALSILSIVGVIGLIVSNVILMYIIEKYIKGVVQSAEDKIKNIELSQTTEYYIELVEKYKLTNKKMHDIDNQLLVIKNLAILDRDLYNKEILKVEELLLDTKNISYTGIIAIDALLNSKFSFASSIGIDIDKQVFIEKIGMDRQMDICLILGNVLDNAIEEGERLIAIGLHAKIKLTLNQVKDFLQIEVCNNLLDNTIQENATKKNKYHHGYGNQIVKELVGKYNGSLIKEVDNNSYNISILM